MASASKKTVGIVGLGYVGLPLAHAFAVNGYGVVGYDISQLRIDELTKGIDRTKELTSEQLASVTMTFTADPSALKTCDVVIMAIPTPVDENNKPDLSPVEKASHTVGKNLKKGAIVCYESTVYPGVTEDICGPILEQESGMVCGKDFFLGYSPERINPGDKEHTVDKIVKIVAGQDEKTTDALVELYGSVVTAGIHRASSIKVAEMAKAIENAQRDINVAFINEVAILSNKIGIPTKDVLAAAGTKWNFLKFQPGLVGGHCIGVDPYYLVEKAEQLGMKTPLISASRAINDGMGKHVADLVVKALGSANGKALVLGLTFKENIPDMRNSKVFDVIKHLQKAGMTVAVDDPQVGKEEIAKLGLTHGTLAQGPYDAVVFLVPHREYLALGASKIAEAVRANGVVFDLKSLFDGNIVEREGRIYVAL